MPRHSQYTPSLQLAHPGTVAATEARTAHALRKLSGRVPRFAAVTVRNGSQLRGRNAPGAAGANADAHANTESSASLSRVIVPQRLVFAFPSTALFGLLFLGLFCVCFIGSAAMSQSMRYILFLTSPPGEVLSSKVCSHPRLFFFRRFHEKCFSCFFTTRVNLNKRNQHPFRF